MKKLIQISFILLFSLGSMCEQEISVTPPDPPLNSTKVYIDSNPQGFSIYINGLNTNYLTPDTVLFFEEKNFELTLKKQYFRDSSMLITPFSTEGKKIVVDYLTNPKMYGRIWCFSRPEGANVMLGDSLTNIITPDTLFNILPGQHKLYFQKDGFPDDSVTVIVYSGFQSDAIINWN